jgi:glucose-1-phosphate adenylyltransferase
MERLLTIVLAGGEGQRLLPLTKERSKPSVPFGGKYRIIDFSLSNCINSGIRQIYILTQYRSESLLEHIQNGWGLSSTGLGDFIYCVPPQQKVGREWYHGTADALRQNLNLVKKKDFDHVMILSGDHIYKMNYRHLRYYHRKKKADLTVAAIKVKKEQAVKKLGVLEVDRSYRMVGFKEKPLHPKAIVDEPEYVLASMGIYLFKTSTLIEVLQDMSADDFGKEIIPAMIDKFNVYCYDYEKENRIEDFVVQVIDGKRESVLVEHIRDSSYWKDVGSIDLYYEASMDLVGVDPVFNLYGQKWPLRTYQKTVPPSKFILGGAAQESIVSDGCIISGGIVRHSILSPGVLVERDAVVESSIIFDNALVEPFARIRRAIIDKEVVIKSGSSVGYDLDADRKRGCTISDGGIVVIPKRAVIHPV